MNEIFIKNENELKEFTVYCLVIRETHPDTEYHFQCIRCYKYNKMNLLYCGKFHPCDNYGYFLHIPPHLHRIKIAR